MLQEPYVANENPASQGQPDLASTARALTQAAQTLTVVANQLMQVLQTIPPGALPSPQQAGPGTTTPVVEINTWEDDPFSEETPTFNPPTAATLAVAAPNNHNPWLQTAIVEPGVAANRFNEGTQNFRFWLAQEALARGINFWTPLLPVGTTWSTANRPLRVTLVAGDALNANYSRLFGLRFYQSPVRNVVIFSANSPDIVLHELGHAILDALQPRLFNANSLEVAAFHESFGDMSSILGELQMPTFRQKVIAETQGQLRASSRLSRVAEQLGWAIRQRSPTAVDRDCLRNAANRFFYRSPLQIPISGPASSLTSEPHSFSRVFTGAFLEALDEMLKVVGAPTEANLLTASRDMGQLLVDSVRLAAITPNYYSQIAACMIQADRVRHQSRYVNALTRAFVRRGILSMQSVAALNQASTPTIAPAVATMGLVGISGLTGGEVGAETILTYNGDDQDYAHRFGETLELPLRPIDTDLGINVLAHVPEEVERFNVGPSALNLNQQAPSTAEDDARHFAKSLLQLGRVEFGAAKGIAPELANLNTSDTTRETHVLEERPEGIILVRRHFDCGLCCLD